MSTLSRDLVVIEAAGKLRQLYVLLDRIGLRATCIATLGHLEESPPHLRPLAIERARNGEYEEQHRVVVRPDAHERLCEELKRLRGRLLIATDDDQEGHAIADDVARLAKRIRPEIAPQRVRMTALTEPALRSALAQSTPYDPADANPAIARRITDRIIASAFSRPSDGLIVGRITSAIAGLARDGQFPTHAVTLQIPGADGRGAFTATVAVRGTQSAENLIQAAALAPPITGHGESVVGLTTPPTQADYLTAMCERMTISQAASVLQGLYEQGVVSYPRTDGKHYRPETRLSIVKYAQGRIGTIAQESSAVGKAVAPHEALHIVDQRALSGIDVNRPLNLQPNARSAALAWISRQMVQSVCAVSRELGDTRVLPQELQVLQWQRDRGLVPPWYRRPRAGVRPYSQEQSLLHGLVQSGIGRPSTYVGHVVRAIERKLVTSDNELAPEGMRVVANAPTTLTEARVCSAIESACTAARHERVGPAVDAAMAIALGGDPAKTQLIEQLLAHEEEPTHAFTI